MHPDAQSGSTSLCDSESDACACDHTLKKHSSKHARLAEFCTQKRQAAREPVASIAVSEVVEAQSDQSPLLHGSGKHAATRHSTELNQKLGADGSRSRRSVALMGEHASEQRRRSSADAGTEGAPPRESTAQMRKRVTNDLKDDFDRYPTGCNAV